MYTERLSFYLGLLLGLSCSAGLPLRAQDSISSALKPLSTNRPIDLELPDLSERDARAHLTLNFDIDLSPDKNFTPEGMPPVIDGWVKLRLDGEILTITELRQLASSIPTRDLLTSSTDVPPKPLRPLPNSSRGDSVSEAEQSDHLTVAIADPNFQTVGFHQPVNETVQDVEPNSNQSENQPAEQSGAGPAKQQTNSEATPDKKPPAPVAEASPIDTVKKLIQQQKELINSNESIDEDVKAAQLEQLNSASAAIQQATASQALIDIRKSARENFAKDFERLRKLLETPVKPASPDGKMTSEELQIKLQKKRQDLQEQKTKLSEVKSLLEKREKRITDIPGLRTSVTSRLSAFKKRFEEFASQPNDQEKQFSTLALNAQQLAAQKEIEALDIDSLYQEQFGKLWLLDRDLRTRNIKNLETEVTACETAISRRREIEVAEQQRQAREAQQKAIKADPSLKPLAQRNQELAQLRSDLTATIKKATDEVKEVEAKFKETETKLKSLKQISDTGRITTANGMVLVEHRRNLTPTFESQARIQEIKTDLQIIRLAKVKLTVEQEKLASMDDIVRNLVSQYERQATPSSITSSQFEKLANELATTQQTYLKDLEEDYDNYLTALALIETNRLNLINKIRETRDYIDEQALWIRSSNPVSLRTDIRESRTAMNAYFDRQSWADLIGDAKIRMVQRPYETALAGFGLVGLLIVTRRLRPTHD